MNPLIGHSYIFCFPGGQNAIVGEVIEAGPGWRTVRARGATASRTEDFTINMKHVVHYREAAA